MGHNMKYLYFFLSFFGSFVDAENRLIVEEGTMSTFKHDVSIEQDGRNVFRGASFVDASRPDVDTLVLKVRPSSSINTLLVGDIGATIHSERGDISSIGIPKLLSEWESNYLRAVVTILAVPHSHWPLSYHTTSGIFGSCELTVSSQNSSMTETSRDLTRCSRSSFETSFASHHLPILHLGMDTEGSASTCTYSWQDDDAMGFLQKVSCVDDLLISKRFLQDSSLHLKVRSNLTLERKSSMDPDINNYVRDAKDSIDMVYNPILVEEEQAVVQEELEENLRKLCLLPENHLRKQSLRILSRIFHLFARSAASPAVLKYSCPTAVRRRLAYMAAFIGGARLLQFTHDQLIALSDEGVKLFPNFDDPLVSIAIGNLGDLHLNEKLPVEVDLFDTRHTLEIYDKIITTLLDNEPYALLGVTSLLQKLSHVSSTLFNSLLQRVAPYISPEKACAEGNVTEATRILHAVSRLRVRPLSYVESLRPCFATEDVALQVATMMSLVKLDCQTPNLVELHQLVLESLSDPETRISAFRGLIECVPSEPRLLKAVKLVLDPQSDTYSKQVASFVWSYLQSVMTSTDPHFTDLRLELEENLEIIEIVDPVFYDPRQHSRYLQNIWILDAKTSIRASLDIVWGRASPLPRSMILDIVYIRDGISYDIISIFVRITGLELNFQTFQAFHEGFDILKSTVYEAWRHKRQIEYNAVKNFMQKVISRIPAYYEASGSSFEMSVNIMDRPVYHVHRNGFHQFNFWQWFRDLSFNKFDSELFHLFPLMDSGVEFPNIAGVPISLHLSTSTAFQSAMSNSLGKSDGHLDFSLSGGFLEQFLLTVGRKIGEKKPQSFIPLKGFSQMSDQGPSVMSTDRSLTFHFPLNFVYNVQGNTSTWNFNRPTIVPHYFWQDEKITFMNGRQFPVRHLEHCMFYDEPFHICYENQQPISFSEKLQVLNNELFRPHYRALKFVTPSEGHGPVVLLIKRGSTTNYRLMIPVDRLETLWYEADFKREIDRQKTALVLNVKTPKSRYIFKGFASRIDEDEIVYGLELALNQSRYEIGMSINTVESTRQIAYTTVVNLIVPDTKKENIVKGKITKKTTGKYSLVKIIASTEGSLKYFLDFVLQGENKFTKKGNVEATSVREFSLRFLDNDELTFNGEIEASQTGFRTSLEAHLGSDRSVTVELSKSPPEVNIEDDETAVEINFKMILHHPHLDHPTSVVVAIDRRSHQINFLGSYQHGGDDSGRIFLFLVSEDFFNYRFTISVDNDLRDIAYAVSQELNWTENEFKLALNGSWSQDLEDELSFLFHIKRNDPTRIDHTVLFSLEFAKNGLSLTHELSEAVAGRFKHKLTIKQSLGQELTVNTIIVAGIGPKLYTLGLYMDLKMSMWNDALRIVGTTNCDSTYTSCSSNLVVDYGAERIGETEISFSGSPSGVSRTNVKLTVENYLQMDASIDAILSSATYKIRTNGRLFKWNKFVEGVVNIQGLSYDNLADMQVAIFSSDRRHELTHFYNGSVVVNKETRTLFTRHEVHAKNDEVIEITAAVLQAKIGESILNAKHFAKAALTTSSNSYYTANGELNLVFVPCSTLVGGAVLSADLGPNSTYVLGWNIDVLLKPKDDGNDSRFSGAIESIKQSGLPIPEQDQLLIFLSFIGRLKSSSFGESKLLFKFQRSFIAITEFIAAYYQNSLEIRLVTETFPDLGRLNAKLEQSEEAFSITSKANAGVKSFSFESYGMKRNQLMKLSSSFSVVNPAKEWKSMKVDCKVDHLGAFPSNFESSVEATTAIHNANIGSFQWMAQWTPISSAFNLGLATMHDFIPGGQITFKWTKDQLKSQTTWLGLQNLIDVKWAEDGRQFEIIYNFFYPNVKIYHVDSVFRFRLDQGTCFYFPNILVMKGRLTVNNLLHWILNIDYDGLKKSFTTTGASIHPQKSSSFNIQFLQTKPGSFSGKTSLIVDATSHYLTLEMGSPSSSIERVIMTAKSSLFTEIHGYLLIFTLTSSDHLEISFILSEGTSSPSWSHIYKIRINSPKYITNDASEITATDIYVYQSNGLDVIRRQLFNLIAITEHNESTITLEIFEFENVSSIQGTIRWPEQIPGEISTFIRIDVPTNYHIIELKTYQNSLAIRDFILRRFIYRQKLIKGIGQPLRLEIEVSEWTKAKNHLKFSLHKMMTKKLDMTGRSMKGGKGGKIDASRKDFSYERIEGTFLATQSKSMNEYRIFWKSNNIINKIAMSVERDAAGGGGHITFSRDEDSIGKFYFLLKGNCRSFRSENTCSATLEQTSLKRPRSVTFLNSYGESYSELVLDLAKAEEDQVIVVLRNKIGHTSLSVGQIGNTFFEISHQLINNKSGISKILVKLGDHSAQWFKEMTSDRCWTQNLILTSPRIPQSFNSITLCRQPKFETTLQLFGIEPNEGPYFTVGQYSRAGGVKLQMGTRKPSSVEQESGLTMKGDVKNEFIEILIDFKMNSLRELLEEIGWRKIDWNLEYKHFKKLELGINGDLAFEGFLLDLKDLSMITKDALEERLGELSSLLNDDAIEFLDRLEILITKYIDSKVEILLKSFEETIENSRQISNQTFFLVTNWIRTREAEVREELDLYTCDARLLYKNRIRPYWIHLSALLRALRYEDDQSLRSSVTRLVSMVRMKLGRLTGLRGILLNDIITRTERIIATKLDWDGVNSGVYNLILLVESMTPLNIMGYDDSGLKFQLHGPMVMKLKFQKLLKDFERPDVIPYIQKLHNFWRLLKARYLYMTSSYVQGSATLFNFERAISWDGRYLPALVSDSCPHVLVMLTKSSTDTAVIMELLPDEIPTDRIMTFVSGKDQIVFDSKFNIKINGDSTTMGRIDFGHLQLRKFDTEIRIASSDGLSLHCLLQDDICHLEVDERNFAGTAGLLGVFDSEANTDFMTSSWERPSSESEWQKSWKTSSDSCQSVPLPSPDSSGGGDERKCSKLFASNSSSSVCQSSVAPQMYKDICDSGQGCAAEMSYLKECIQRYHFRDLLPEFPCAGPPKVSLELNSKDSSFQLLEDDTAIFSCKIQADPPATRTEWFKDKRRLIMKPNLEMSNDSLTIRQLVPSDDGNYRCKAFNSYGSSESNLLPIDVQYKPKCNQNDRKIALSKGTPIILDCRVIANPPQVDFRWYIKNDHFDYVLLPMESFMSSRLTSTLEYVPQSEYEFGLLACIAENSVGTQTEACQFEIHERESDKVNCSQPLEMEGVKNLNQEVVVIGEFSCLKSLQDFQEFFRQKSDRNVSIKVRFLVDGDPPEDLSTYDDILVETISPNALDSLTEAIRKDFSPDALKAVVIVDCNRKECKTKDSLFSTLRKSVLNLGIHVFVITSDPMDYIDPKSISTKIKRQLLGIDRKTTYLMSHARKRNLKGKKGIRKMIEIPLRNYCAELALESNGAVFSLVALKKLKRAYHRRVFQQLIALRILSGFTESYLKCRRCPPCSPRDPCTVCKAIKPYY